MVVILQTIPVGIELVKTVCVYILDPVEISTFVLFQTNKPSPAKPNHPKKRKKNIHTSRTTRNLPPLLQTIQLTAAIRLGLTLHIIIIESAAAVADKERSAHQRRRGSSDLIHLGDVIGHRGGVDEDMLVESGARKSQLLGNGVNGFAAG